MTGVGSPSLASATFWVKRKIEGSLLHTKVALLKRYVSVMLAYLFFCGFTWFDIFRLWIYDKIKKR